MNDITQSTLTQMDDLIADAVNKDDMDFVLQKIRKMIQAKKLIGKALARTLYLLYSNWNKFS